MRKNDQIRVRHMQEAAKEAVSFARNKTRKDLESDRMLVLALVKSIEIIGEAASKVTNETRERYPRVPWSDIVAMRNRLIHVYFDIDLDRVWDTVTDDLATLIILLEKVIPSEEIP